MLLTAATLFLMGCLHALGPDHLAAVAALSAENDRRAAVRAGLRFGIGHAAVLGIAALVGSTAAVAIPAALTSMADRASGVLLVVIGLATAWAALKASGSQSLHSHDDTGHRHRHAPLLVGAAFAVSGTRAAVMAVPAFTGSSLVPLVCVVAFGLGVALCTGAFGLATGSAFARSNGRPRRFAQVATGLGATALGCAFAAGALT